jgi:NTP pyrophosphatase (non-canonical NTP hydrolase)
MRFGTGKTIQQMTAEVREVNTALGWHDDTNTLGDLVSLMNTEVGEALEAYRDYRLEDGTDNSYWNAAGLPKPEGVGSEFGDLVIRLVSTCDLIGVPVFDGDVELADVGPGNTGMPDAPHVLVTFGDWMAWLSRCIDRFWDTRDGPAMLRAIVTVAVRFGIDLTAEYERKIAYNRTRPFQHGGRTLTGPLPGRGTPQGTPNG